MAGQELVGGEAVHHPGGAGEEAEQVGAGGHLVDRRADRLAGVGALEAAELVGLGVEHVGDLEQQQASGPAGVVCFQVSNALSAASTARSTSSCELAGTLAMTSSLAGLTTSAVLPVGGVDEVAADELLVGLDSFEGLGHGWLLRA